MSTDVARPRRARQLVQTKIDSDIVAAIDEAAWRERMTRTAWLTRAALHHLPPDLLGPLEDTDRP